MKDNIISPYGILHIYYLEGLLKRKDETLFDKSFLGNWQEDGFSFLFFSEPADHSIEHLLKINTNLILLDNYTMTYQEWQGGEVKPFRTGRFLVSPPWNMQQGNPDSADKNIRITMDPGVVFGTGTHTTTNDCLEILGDLCSSEKIDSVLDLGTGTGLLSLAAGHLGCSRVLAVDFNFLAAQTTKRNIDLNSLEKKVWAVQGMAEDYMDCPADLVIANIHYDVMQHLIEMDGFLSKKWFILSGLLRSQAGEVAYRLSQLPVEVLDVRGQGKIWHTFFGRVL